jgi:hypothetical protein
MFGLTHASLGANRDLLFGDPFGAFGLFLVRSGVLQGATFERSGDIIRDGVTFGENKPVVSGGRYRHNGQFTNCLRDTDIADWTPTNATYLDGVTTALSGGGYARQRSVFASGALVIGETYTYSILITGEGHTQDFSLRSPTGVVFSADFTPEAGKIVSFTGVATSTNIDFLVYLNPNSTAGSAVAGDYITFVPLVTDTKYPIHPIDIPTTGSPASIDTAASAPNPDKHGANWESTETRNDWVFDLLGATGVGTLTLKPLNIVPGKTEWQSVGDFNILSGDDNLAASQILYVEQTTGLICATDGVNICKSASEYIAGTDHQIDLVFNGTQMAIVLDGVQGTASAFTGHFPVGVTIKQGFENEDVWSPGNIYGQPVTPVIL